MKPFQNRHFSRIDPRASSKPQGMPLTAFNKPIKAWLKEVIHA